MYFLILFTIINHQLLNYLLKLYYYYYWLTYCLHFNWSEFYNWNNFNISIMHWVDDVRNSIEANAYFVLEGRCTCLQRLRVRRTTEYGRNHFTLIRDHCSDSQSNLELNKNVQTVYVKMTDLRPGSVFGLGKTYSKLKL